MLPAAPGGLCVRHIARDGGVFAPA